jgi:hypothetical protein
MHRISSNLTLFLKIFIPTFWSVLFGAFTIAFLFGQAEGPYFIKNISFRLAWLGVYLLILFIFFLTVWKLKRVELDELFLYATDYFKTARYPFHSIAAIHSQKLPFFYLGRIELHTPGIFGKNIYFIQSREAFLRTLASHETLAPIVKEDADS